MDNYDNPYVEGYSTLDWNSDKKYINKYKNTVQSIYGS